jgi:hypothetical protein
MLLPPKKLGQLLPQNIFYFAHALYFSARLDRTIFCMNVFPGKQVFMGKIPGRVPFQNFLGL